MLLKEFDRYMKAHWN